MIATPAPSADKLVRNGVNLRISCALLRATKRFRVQRFARIVKNR